METINKHDWVGKVIHKELCTRLEFDHTNKWYNHKLESVLENKTQKIPWDFEKHTGHPFPYRSPDIMSIKKKNN